MQDYTGFTGWHDAPCTPINLFKIWRTTTGWISSFLAFPFLLTGGHLFYKKVFPGVFVVASWLELMLDATSSLSRDYKSAKCLQGELSGYLVKKSQNFIRMLPCPLANLVLRKRLDFLGHVFSCDVQDVRTVDVIYLHWLTLALVSCLTAWLNSTIMKTLSCSVSSVKHFILLFPVSNRDFL